MASAISMFSLDGLSNHRSVSMHARTQINNPTCNFELGMGCFMSFQIKLFDLPYQEEIILEEMVLPSSPPGADNSVIFQLLQPQTADSERAFEQLNQIQTRVDDSSPPRMVKSLNAVLWTGLDQHINCWYTGFPMEQNCSTRTDQLIRGAQILTATAL